MTLSLRQRIRLLFLPTALFLAAIGIAGVWMLDNLGRRSEDIIRENYVSIEAMDDLHRALTDAERAILFAVQQGEKLHPDTRASFRACVDRARTAVGIELGNITVPGEREEAEKLAAAIAVVARRGEKLLAAPPERRWEMYVLPGDGFQSSVTTAWLHMGEIRAMNERAMRDADAAARFTARRSVYALSGAVALALLLTGFFAWRLQRSILAPIEAVTDAATAIGGGELHQSVPVNTGDEIGRLAAAFNAMTAKLRGYRQTNTERLLRARQTGQATIDSFPDPVLVIDTFGRIESANPAAQRVLGVRPPGENEEHIPWTPPESLKSRVVEALRQQRASIAESFDEVVVFRLDGEERVYLPQMRPIRSPEGEALGAAVVLNDVTRFRLLDRLKSDWVATVSHELKTPLTSVRLAVHVLLEEVVGSLEPKQIELLIEARESTERLLKLIEHLLALAKLEDGREQLGRRPTDPGDLLRIASDEAKSRAEDKRITVVVDVPADLPRVMVDADRFGRAINNLVDNAITYTDEGGTVTLRAESAVDGRIQLSVRDTGIGIPPEYLPHVFDRFFRVPGRDEHPGTGLGLAIVREIVAAHGGTISAASEVGKGTRFEILLPAEEHE